ncbi:MAG TPA: 50S ribosomal protein L30 [Spirochaetota bacterium]|nr:50S ribosomal protein L30 [Spirochaetota bacterium]HNT11250.1 50S ribosomal protein L30 [Spirochaetota bacterium]HNV48532.1 50S ribosomal protein L30 [Spirochaetota bacterium]HPU88939.1 50S ribosomal protein L30 [Spirochaetota bacterium]
MAKKLIIKQIRSGIGAKPKQRATLRALGLRRMQRERTHDDTAVIRGMINTVQHLVRVTEVKE